MNRDKIKDILLKRVLILDGAMGTELIKRGFGGISPEQCILQNEKAILDIQRDYVKSGCDIIITATFGANPLKLKQSALDSKMELINANAVKIARKAVNSKVLIAGGLGPTGEMFPPSGNLNFTKSYECFKKQAEILDRERVELFILETFSDIRELKAAVLAVRNTGPNTFIIANLTFDREGRTLLGTDPVGFALAFEDLDVDCLGINCSLGPEGIFPIFQELSRTTKKFLCIEPNAGIPEIINGKPYYKMTPEVFVNYAEDFASLGANIIGGCCGTGPRHIKALSAKLRGRKPISRTINSPIGISSLTKNVIFSTNNAPVIIGERINPTGKKKMSSEIQQGITEIILKEARKQRKAGAEILDVNLGMESAVREEWLRSLITDLLISPSLPLSLDFRTEHLIEAALQEYGGRALFNSIDLTDMEDKIELLKKYGGMVVFLPIDKNGIPDTARKRMAVAKKAISKLEDMGFDKKRVLFDPIVMSLATGNDPRITLDTLKLYKSSGLLTVLGLSNISYGLPKRSVINSFFLNLCIKAGLDAVIMNPLEKEISASIDLSPIFLQGENIKTYLKKLTAKRKSKVLREEKNIIFTSIIEGEKQKVLSELKTMLEKMNYNEIIEKHLKPALEKVGELYEARTIFLPQLMMSAETAQVAFAYIETRFGKKKMGNGKIIIATVKGDIHDIGKNIVAMILRNAGFEVIDLGKDVPSEDIVRTAKDRNANAVALSALMTTTAMRMKEVRELMSAQNIPAKLIVGGACITKNFAREIGADAYAKDANAAVKEVRKIIEDKKRGNE